MSTINSGYIVTSEGIRVGICGEGIYEKGKITSVSSFSSLNVRLSREYDSSGDEISRYISHHKGASVLIVSPPGYGKTTVLRSVTKALGEGKFSQPVRVSLIDERGEILPNFKNGLIDRFLGYSKPDGIEIAVRVFSPEYIICDEIGLADDTEAILSVQNSGVPFIATTHSENISKALLRPNINALVKSGVFNTFVRLEKSDEGVKTVFEELRL
jgi:stage III sporulation protein AA